MKYDDLFFMQEALNEAQKAFEEDEVPVGVILTVDNKIIYSAHNQVENMKSSIAHAEIIAIEESLKILNGKWLTNATMYITLEPCAMCAGALILSRIKRVVIGANNFKCGANGTVFNILNSTKLNHNIDIKYGVLEKESEILLKSFFKNKRKLK